MQQTLSIRCRSSKYLSLVLMYLCAHPLQHPGTYLPGTCEYGRPAYLVPQARSSSVFDNPDPSRPRPHPRPRTSISSIVFLTTTITVLCYCRSWQVRRADTKLLRAAPRPPLQPPFPRGISRNSSDQSRLRLVCLTSRPSVPSSELHSSWSITVYFSAYATLLRLARLTSASLSFWFFWWRNIHHGQEPDSTSQRPRAAP